MNNRIKTLRGGTAAAIMALAFIFGACDQAPLFYDISKEIKPKDPLLEGSPSRMVAFGGKEYAANGTLWAYDGSSWTKPAAPAAGVRDVAATATHLYALTVAGNPSGNTLYRTADGTTWETVNKYAGYEALQAIYGADDVLFVCARDPSDERKYAVLYDNAGSLAAATGLTDLDEDGRLTGAVKFGGDYYLTTIGMGIYSGAGAATLSLVADTDNPDYKLNGIIATDTEVVAVGGGGYLLAGDSGSFVVRISDNSFEFTGALARYTEGSADILMLGGPSGYREILLSGGNVPASPSLYVPGKETPSTVDDSATYAGALGIKAINHLYRSILGDRTLFASTHKDGLWSYRGDVWNAED